MRVIKSRRMRHEKCIKKVLVQIPEGEEAT